MINIIKTIGVIVFLCIAWPIYAAGCNYNGGEMMDKITKKIYVYESDVFDKPPYNIYTFIEFLQTQLTLVPKEYRYTAEINFEAMDDFIDVSIFYTRPETEEEANKRIKTQQDMDWEELIRLAQKYGVAITALPE